MQSREGELISPGTPAVLFLGPLESGQMFLGEVPVLLTSRIHCGKEGFTQGDSFPGKQRWFFTGPFPFQAVCLSPTSPLSVFPFPPSFSLSPPGSFCRPLPHSPSPHSPSSASLPLRGSFYLTLCGTWTL